MVTKAKIQSLRQQRDLLVRAVADAGGEVMPDNRARCPFHDDQNAGSGHVVQTPAGGWHFQCFPCNWGGDVFNIVQRARNCGFTEAVNILAALSPSSLLAPKSQPPAGRPLKVYATVEAAVEDVAAFRKSQVDRVYKWTDTWYRARFFTPPAGKSFVEITATPAGGWHCKGPPKPHALYRVSELPRAGTIWVCEGEKTADAAWGIGLPATTSGSSSSAGGTDWAPLAGRDVVILPDNDEPGRKYADVVATKLRILTPPAIVRILSLPASEEGDDLVDYVERLIPISLSATEEW